MATYDVDGVRYEIADGLDIHQTVAQIRNTSEHQLATAEAQNTVGRAVIENVKGGATAIADLVAGMPGFVGAMPYAAFEAARTGDMTKGRDTFADMSGTLNPLSEEFVYGKLPGTELLTPNRDTGAYHNIMLPVEKIMEAPGKLAGAAAYHLGASGETVEQVGAGADLAGAAAMAAAGVALPVRARGIRKRQAQQARIDKALAEAKALEQRLSAEASARFQQANQGDLFEGMGKADPAAVQRQYFYEQAADDVGPPRLTPEGRPEPLVDTMADVSRRNEAQPGAVQGELFGDQQLVERFRAEDPSPSARSGEVLDPRVDEVGQAVLPLEEVWGYEGQTVANPEVRPYEQVAVEAGDLLAQQSKRRQAAYRGQGIPYDMATAKPGFLKDAVDKIYDSVVGSKLTGPRGRQRGAVHPDLLTFGVAGLLEKYPPAKVLEKFKGTFKPETLNAIIRHAKNLMGDFQIVWMAPDDFYKLAYPRYELDAPFREKRRVDIRNALKTPRGLNDLPFLSLEYDSNGYRVSGHEGRHRMDVFKELGLDLVPVVITRSGPRSQWPSKVLPELDAKPATRGTEPPPPRDWSKVRDFPEPIKFDTKPELPPRVQAAYDKWDQAADGPQKDLERRYLQRALDDAGMTWQEMHKIVIDSAGPQIYHNTFEHNPNKGKFRQGGGINPQVFADIKNILTPRSEFQQFKDRLKAEGIKLSDEHIRAVWERQNAKPAPVASGLPIEPALEAVSNISDLEKLRQQYLDPRTKEQINETLVGASDIGEIGAATIRKMIQGRFSAKDHPLLSWASSNIHKVKNEAALAANRLLHGSEGSPNKPQVGSYNYWWTQLKARERIAVNRVGWELNNAETPMDVQATARRVIGRELTEPELNAYRDRVAINKRALAEFNQAMLAEGREPIHELPHFWSPAEYRGKFLTFFKDKATGEVKRLEGSYLEPNKAKLEAANPNYDVSILERGIRPEVDFQALELMLRHLSKEKRDVASQALAEARRLQGFRRHGEKRHGFEGASGTEEGMKGVREYERTAENYIRQTYEYLSNRKLDALFNDVLDMPNGIKHPNARGLALDSIDMARGGMNEGFKWADRMINQVVKLGVKGLTAGKLGLPESFVRDVLTGANRIRTTMLIGFWHPVQIASQFLQAATFMPPKLLEMAQTAGSMNVFQGTGVMAKVVAKTITDLVKQNNPDIKALENLGALEATFKHDWRSYTTNTATDFKHTAADHITGMSTLAGIEKQAVRKPAALLFLNMLRELGYKGSDIYALTKELTDHYMVTNRWHEKPHVFGRTGIIGQAISPLQSFSTTWLGMFREYAQTASTGTVGPLVAFMGMNALTAGMLGLVGVKEADALITFANKVLGTSWPTATEAIIKSTAKTDNRRALRFGVLSDFLGYNIGASLNAPTLTGTGAPGVQMLGAIPGAMGTVVDMAKGTALDAEKREMFKAFGPRFSPIPGLNWGDIERQYTPEGFPYQTEAGRGRVSRTPEDWQARRLGTYTTDEAEFKAENMAVNQSQQQRSERFTGAVGAMVDNVINGQRDNTDLIRKLEEDGWSAGEIVEAIRSRAKSKMLDERAQMRGRGTTPRQQRLAKLLQDLR